uniref:Uncharacterized protein n=1 Tax=Anguilla anguilla TaxID=7936 RepID=A0A0E9P8M0_ANGAN
MCIRKRLSWCQSCILIVDKKRQIISGSVFTQFHNKGLALRVTLTHTHT